jgi:hypothetical protein
MNYFYHEVREAVLLTKIKDHAIAQAVSHRRPAFEPRSRHMGFVDKAALGQVFSEYFGFPCQFSFHRLLHIDHISPWSATIGQ